MYKYSEIVEERVIKKMDPILTIGLLAFVFVVSFLIVLSFIYHCLLSILECIHNVVTGFEPRKSNHSTFHV